VSIFVLDASPLSSVGMPLLDRPVNNNVLNVAVLNVALM